MKMKTLKNAVMRLNPEMTNHDIVNLLSPVMQGESIGWIKNYNSFLKFLNTGIPQFSIFSESGNSKLPFLSFSALPFITCGGMGECENYCYSIKSWRYPAAFFKQLQATILLWNNPQLITQELKSIMDKAKYHNMDKIDFRLYVDGDFDSLETMDYWFQLLKNNDKLQCYGYSKSLDLFAEYAITQQFPTNYKLNVSNGSRYDNDADLQNIVKSLEIYRGEFIAVKTSKNWKNSDYKTSEYKRDVIKSADMPVFPCAGRCGNCTNKGHACGLDSFNGVTIAVPVH